MDETKGNKLSIKRFNALLKQLDFHITIFCSSNQVLKVMFDEQNQPITMDALRKRYINYCQAKAIQPDGEFYLTATLPITKVCK